MNLPGGGPRSGGAHLPLVPQLGIGPRIALQDEQILLLVIRETVGPGSKGPAFDDGVTEPR